MRIGIINQWFDPEPGPAALAGAAGRELVRRGHQVQVVTGFPNYPSGKVFEGYRVSRILDEDLDGMSVRRVAIYPSHDRSALRRVGNLASFGVSAPANGLRVLRDCDVVWVSNSPPTIAPTVWLLKHLGVPSVVHVMDLWPQNLESSGLVGSSRARAVMVRGVRRLNGLLYGSANRVLTIAPNVGELLSAEGIPERKVWYSPLWALDNYDCLVSDGSKFRSRQGVDDNDIVILYAGTIGPTQDLDSLLQVLARLEPRPSTSLHFWVVGDGLEEDRIRAIANDVARPGVKVRFFGRRPADDMPEMLAACDVAYVGLVHDQHSHYTMPSKVQSILASGKPILASAPGAVDMMIKEFGVGFSCADSGVAELEDEVEKLMAVGRAGLSILGGRARELYEANFSIAAGVDRLERHLVEASRME